jgi:CBS domain containing-hemolysin-like protein
VSFLCSLLEAALLSVRIAPLIQQRSAGRRGAARLLELKQTRIDDAITAILTLNTVANTLGATLAGAQAATVFGSTWVGVFSGVLTFLILVFSEIIPKTLGAVYAVRLASFVGNTLHLMTRVMAPVLVLSRAITRLLTRGRETSFSRGDIAALISVAAHSGALSSEESEMLSNLLRFREVKVEDVMTPRTVTFMVPANETVGDLIDEPEAAVFSRIPLFREHRDDVVGYVLMRDLLVAVAKKGNRDLPLKGFMRPILFVPELASVGSALRQILERREPVAIVTDEHGGVAGLVTLEDLTEAILGVEIVDESDRDVDMRQVATRLRDERLARMERKRQLIQDQKAGTRQPPPTDT